MFTRLLPLAAAVLLAASCRDAPGGEERAEAPADTVRPPFQALHGVPQMPESRVVGVTGSGDAVEAMTYTIAAPDSAVGWYRRELLDRGWEVLGDTRLPDGSFNLHAKAPDARPVWIMVRPVERGQGSFVSVIGAVIDTTTDR